MKHQSLFVHHESRQQGVGKGLICELHRIGKRLGLRCLSTYTVRQTVNSEIIKRLGFDVFSEEPATFYESEQFENLTEVFMERRIERRTTMPGRRDPLLMRTRRHFTWSALTITLLAFLGPVRADQPLVSHVVIEAAGPDVPRADTASTIELVDGRLMTVYQKYEAGERSGNDEGYCRIWSKTSVDGGRSWHNPRMLIDVAPGDVNVMNPMLLKLRNGDSILVCHRYHPPKPSTSTAELWRSTDGSENFAKDGNIWARPPSYRVAIPPLNQLSSGRILLPCAAKGSRFAANYAIMTAYSDDNGASWRESGHAITLPKRGAMEPSVAQLRDDTLVMSIRTQLGGPYIARSLDGGLTWSEAKFSGLEGGESGTCLRRIPGTDRLVLFFNNSKYIPRGHHHYGERTPLTAALSDDGGHRWRILGHLASDPEAEYTNLDCLFTSDGHAILTYMHAKPAWNRNRIDLRAALIDGEWFRPGDNNNSAENKRGRNKKGAER